jgi:hypothetical protein
MGGTSAVQYSKVYGQKDEIKQDWSYIAASVQQWHNVKFITDFPFS